MGARVKSWDSCCGIFDLAGFCYPRDTLTADTKNSIEIIEANIKYVNLKSGLLSAVFPKEPNSYFDVREAQRADAIREYMKRDWNVVAEIDGYNHFAYQDKSGGAFTLVIYRHKDWVDKRQDAQE